MRCLPMEKGATNGASLNVSVLHLFGFTGMESESKLHPRIAVSSDGRNNCDKSMPSYSPFSILSSHCSYRVCLKEAP